MNQQIEYEDIVIEETSNLIKNVTEGYELGSEVLGLVAHGVVAAVNQYRTQKKKTEMRRR